MGEAAHALPPTGAYRPVRGDLDADHNPRTGNAEDWSGEGTVATARAGKPAQFRLGNAISEEEARQQPIILVGAFSNPWTLEWSRNLRYYFHRELEDDGVQVSIRDRKDPRKAWSIPYVARDRMTVDYAIISRVVDPVTRNPVIAIAGLTHYGTQAAAAFVTDQNLWDQALRNAPSGWQGRNFEAVLETTVINRTPNRTQILTIVVW